MHPDAGVCVIKNMGHVNQMGLIPELRRWWRVCALLLEGDRAYFQYFAFQRSVSWSSTPGPAGGDWRPAPRPAAVVPGGTAL